MKNKPSKQRQFSQTRLSYSRNTSLSHQKQSRSIYNNHHTSSNHNDAVCVDCYNKKLICQKKLKGNKREENERQIVNLGLSKLQEISQKNRAFNKDDILKTNEYNLKKIQENNFKKQHQKQQKHNKSMIEPESKQMIVDIAKLKIQAQRRNQLKQQLQNQIRLAKEKRRLQMQDKVNSRLSAIFTNQQNTKNGNCQQNKKLYRQDLLKQINEEKQKKQSQLKRQALQNLKDNQLSFIKQSKQKQQNNFKTFHQNYDKIKENLKIAKQNEQAKRLNAMKIKQQENMQRVRKQQQLLQIANKEQANRKNQMQKYLQQLKYQMKENEAKRQQQFKWIKKEMNNCIIPIKNKHYLSCNSCSKYVPLKQLSSFVGSKP